MPNFKEQFAAKGLVVFPNENLSAFKSLKRLICESTLNDDLETLHHNFNKININSIRLSTYRDLNALIDWESIYYSMGSNAITGLLGPDLLIQRKLNLSIQIPGDETSVLGLHMDTLSGQSPFEIVMWTPFTSVNKSNGMYYFDRETSSHIRQEMPKHEDKGLDYLRQKYWNDRLELEVEEGNVVIFSSTLFHGNVVNITPTTRVSINCRFKNLFSPDAPNTKSAERGSGIFYKLLTSSPVTDIGMDYIKYEDSFD